MDYQFESAGPTIRIVVLVFMIVFALALLGLLIVVAALPGVSARRNGHPQASAVNLLGWLGLPTGILWVIAMVWAYWDYSPSRLKGPTAPDWEAQLTSLEAAVDRLEALTASPGDDQ